MRAKAILRASAMVTMMRNLEAKFHINDIALARARAEPIGFSLRATLVQRDTFFAIPHGKLKLRVEAHGASLIHYRRKHEGDLEVSDYEIVPVPDAEAMRVMLAGALGVIAEICKVRTLLMRRNVRLHLDCVDGLGSFGEIEAVIAPDEKPEGFRAEVAGILATLEIAPGDLIRKSYFELVNGG